MRKNGDRTPGFRAGSLRFFFYRKFSNLCQRCFYAKKCVILCIKHGLNVKKLTSSGDVRKRLAKHLEKIHNVLLAIMVKVGYNYEHEDGHPVLDKKS